jgi:hypothetical protein
MSPPTGDSKERKQEPFNPVIRALPARGAWRIDWFGRVGFPSRNERGRSPSVCVHLSRVVAPDFIQNPNVLLEAASTDSAHRVSCWVSVGTLALLRVGDVWVNQTLAAAPQYELATFTGLHISYDTTRTVKAGIEVDDGQFLLPVAQHPWHMADTQSYCVILNAPSGGRLIVPCLELVRFYFGSSASLLNRVFDPQLKREDLYTSLAFEPTYGMLDITLAAGISRGSAADVGRIALDRAAWTTAKSVGKSCISAAAAAEPVYPKSHFPFSGSSTLAASGKWITREGAPRDFVVFSLRSCSHPFPFQSLRYTVAEAADAARVKAPMSGQAGATSSRERRKRSSRSNVLGESDPSDTLAPQSAYLGVKAKFPDLINKKLSERISVVQDPRATPAGSGQKREGSIGETRGNAEARRVEATEGLERAACPPFLDGVLKMLLSIEWVEVVVLTRSEQAWTAPLPLRTDADGLIEARIHLKHDPREPIRQHAVVSVQGGGLVALVVVIEDDPPYLWAQQGDHRPSTIEEAVNTAVFMTLLPVAHSARFAVRPTDLVARLAMILGPLRVV